MVVLNVIPILLFAGMLIVGTLVIAIVRKLSGWNAVYEKLAKRYGGNAFSGYLLTKPSMTFNYGRTFCRVQNRKTFHYGNRKRTELILGWPDRRLKLEITTDPNRQNRRGWNPLRSNPVVIHGIDLNQMTVLSNNNEIAHKLLSDQVQWQLEQLRRHTGRSELRVTIAGGKMTISKPGYIKHPQMLDDFVRYGLELFDLMMLTDIEGIEFVNEQSASLLEDVTCPICAERIQHQLVVCVRCKTPHCHDCWQYNGQCATFACNETRYVKTTGQIVTPS